MKRGASIKYAVYTAVASKASSAVLQLISLPLAARVLGKVEFGVYSTVSLSIFMLTVLQLGVGPALSRKIAEANASNDRGKQSHYYQHGGLLVLLLAFGFGSLLAMLVTFVPLETIFGTQFIEWESELRTALLIGIALLTCEITMWHTDRIREGFMESYIMNGFACLGNIIGAVVIIFGIRHFPYIPFLLLATFLPNILVRLVNTVWLLRQRPYLISPRCRFKPSTIKGLVLDGLSFSVTTQLIYFAEIFVCGYMVARLLGPDHVAIYQIFISVTTVFNGMLMMVGRPYWSASINAKESGDFSWVRKAASRFYLFYFALALCSFVGLAGLGPMLVHKLYGPEFEVPRSLFVSHLAFLLLFGWRDVNRSILIGLGQLSVTVKSIVSGVGISLLLAFLGLQSSGLPLMFLGLAAGIAVFPGWALPFLVAKEFRKMDPSPTGRERTVYPERTQTHDAAT